jgi:ABC-type polysaccharide/polyol phosphate export permease
MFFLAVPAYGVEVYPQLVPAAFLTLVLAGLCFTALGFAVGSYVRRADSAPVFANLTMFPLLFISGVFFSTENAPEWVRRIADFFPLSHVVHSFTACFSPYTTGTGFSSRDLGSLLVWGAVGAFVAVRRFSREATDEQGGATGHRGGGLIGRVLAPTIGRRDRDANPAAGRSR